MTLTPRQRMQAGEFAVMWTASAVLLTFPADPVLYTWVVLYTTYEVALVAAALSSYVSVARFVTVMQVTTPPWIAYTVWTVASYERHATPYVLFVYYKLLLLCALEGKLLLDK